MEGLKSRRELTDRQREIERVERDLADLQKAMDVMATAKKEL